MNSPKRVAVTGAAGQIGYSLLPRIAAGGIFGPDTQVHLQCLELGVALPALEGVKMELEDCAFPLLQSVTCSEDPKIAFKNADLILMVGSKPRGKGQERKDLIRDNGPIFIGQGRAVAEAAGPDVRVMVVGNPCNTNCLIAMHNAKGIAKDRFTAMTRLDQNRAQTQLANKSGTSWGDVKNVTIWGNHSNTQFPDWYHATIGGKPVSALIKDETWLKETFVKTVQERGAAVIKQRGSSSAFSAANAAIDHCWSLFHATKPGEWTSLCVVSDGSYGIEPGIVCSFPCSTDGKGNWKIVPGLAINEFAKSKIKLTVDELIEERTTIRDLLG